MYDEVLNLINEKIKKYDKNYDLINECGKAIKKTEQKFKTERERSDEYYELIRLILNSNILEVNKAFDLNVDLIEDFKEKK